jgi:N-dimethylarginine dimethylaminohydrolase
MLALTHVPSPSLDQCQRTFVAPVPIDYGLAVRQHEAYCRMLRRCGADVRTLAVNRHLPDCVFIEDTAIVLDEVAVLASIRRTVAACRTSRDRTGTAELSGGRAGRTPGDDRGRRRASCRP